MIIFKKLRLEDRVYSNTTGRIYTVYEISCDRVMIQADDQIKNTLRHLQKR